MPKFSYLAHMVRPRGVQFASGTLTTEKALLWVKPVSLYAGSAFVVFLFLTEWRAIMGYVPFYRNKWKD